MKLHRAFAGFALLTVAYLCLLLWADRGRGLFAGIERLAPLLPPLMLASLLAYALRFARWTWLLRRAGYHVGDGRGLVAYLSGLAFTATPGKVGELLRIRYFAPRGVPPERVIAAFVYERAFDLLAVLLLASVAVQRPGLWLAALGFVALFLVPVLIFAARPKAMTRTAAWLKRHGARTPARGLRILSRGLALCRHWFTAADAVLALLLGLLAWGVTALSFVWLLHRLGVTELSFAAALSAYPLAMLAGAASMLPGGLGSTEAAIALLLGWHGVPVATATLAAVGIRLATLWFAIACGLLAVSWLEWRGPR